MAKNIHWSVTRPDVGVTSGLPAGPPILNLQVDLSKDFGPSSTGKTNIVAMTDDPRFEKVHALLDEAAEYEFIYTLTVLKRKRRKS